MNTSDNSKKIFVFDIDGTIIEKNEPVNNLMNELFKKIITNGHTLVFATARSLRGVAHVLPKWCLQQTIIYCNGAFAKKNNNIIFSNTINPNTAVNILKYIKEYTPYYVELGDSYFHPTDFNNMFYNILKMEAPNELVTNKNVLLNKSIYKIVILETKNKEYINAISKCFNDVKLYNHSDGKIDIVKNNCSKWNALSNILSKKIHSSNIISFGNDINDYELFSNSSFSVAMNPQSEQLKKVANKIIPIYDLQAMEQIILQFC